MKLDIPLLTFSSLSEKKPFMDKSYVIINARTHPGESSSSWITQGIIEYLLNFEEAQ